LPPTEESFSAYSVNSIDSFVYPEVDTLDDDNQSYDPYLTPLMKERKIGLTNRLKKLPSLSSKSPGRKVEQVATPETMAYESLSEYPESTKVISKRPGRLRVCKLSFLEVPVRMKRHHPTSQKPSDDTVIIHLKDEPQDVPRLKERDYWNIVANKQLDNNGIVHLRTAEALMQLGGAHMRCEEFKEALTVFKGATRIYRKIYGGSDLSIALALNNVGLAACRLSKTRPNLRKASEALNQSFEIRYEILGPSHVDTIDTLNNMAGVYFHLGDLEEARQAYFEVWTMRQAVFGLHHPSVAVTAHAIGSVYLRLSQVDEASKYYYNALDVYRHLNLSEENTSVARLLCDIDQLRRAMTTMSYK
jgi:Tfp pilus assembly protein PilF